MRRFDRCRDLVLSALALHALLVVIGSHPVFAASKPATASQERRAVLGIRRADDIDEYYRKRFGIPADQSGALVRRLVIGGPADQAGIEEEDLIVRFGDIPIHSVAELTLELSRKTPGYQVRLSVWREGLIKELPVQLGSEMSAKETAAPATTQPHLRGAFSSLGRSTINANIRSPAILRLLTLPTEADCDDLAYSVKLKGVSLSERRAFYGLTELDKDKLTMAELFLPAGQYSIATSSRSRCRHTSTLAVRYLSDFRDNIEETAELHVINLRKEIALKRAIIEAGLHQFIDVGHLILLFTDRLGDASHTSEALSKACKVIQSGFGFYSSDDDVRYLITDRYRVILQYAYEIFGSYYYMQREKAGANADDDRDSRAPYPQFYLDDACRRVPEMVTALSATASKPSVYVSFNLKNIDYYIKTASHINEQVIVTKVNMLIRRLFGYEVTNVAMAYGQGNCDIRVAAGRIAGGSCLESAHAGAPLHYQDSGIADTSGGKVVAAKIDRQIVETVLRNVFGKDASLDFQVDSQTLILAKISGARSLIIKARSYWEMIYVSVVPSNDYVYAVIEASYAPGLGDKPPPDEAFKGNTENEFPSETRNLLDKIVNTLANGSTAH
jgi:hypothetical protein